MPSANNLCNQLGPRSGMRGSRKFCQRGSNSTLTIFILVDEGREDPITTKSRPTLKTGLVALQYFRGIRTSIAKKPYSFAVFQGAGGGGGG